MAALKLFALDRVFIIHMETLMESSLGMSVAFTEARSSRPSEELLASTVGLGLPTDDEEAGDELELVRLALAPVSALVDAVGGVDLDEFMLPLETTRPTTITTPIATTATILEKVVPPASTVANHLQQKCEGVISDYATPTLSRAARPPGESYSFPLSAVTETFRLGACPSF